MFQWQEGGRADFRRCISLGRPELFQRCCAGTGQCLCKATPLQPPNRDLGEKELFPGAPGPWLSLTRAAISLLQTSHPLGKKMRPELCVCAQCLVFWCWEGTESPPHSQTPLCVRGWVPQEGRGALAAPWPQVSARLCPDRSGDRAITACHYRDGSRQLMCQWPLPGGCVFSALMNRLSTAGSSGPGGGD